MRQKKVLSLLLVLVVFVSCFSVNAGATELKEQNRVTIAVRATGRFNMDVPGNTIMKANSSFPLEAGEKVTIKATYSPFTASVDFGLIAPDGSFYYLNVDDGNFNQTIKVDERGNYTFAVRNNSSNTVNVSGYVNY